MKIRNLLWQFFLMILVMGCSAQPRSQTIAQYSKTDTFLPPTPANIVTITAPPLSTSTITATIFPTSTFLPTNSSTPEAPAPIPQKCLQPRSSLPQNKNYNGRIVFIGKDILPAGGNVFFDGYSEVTFYDLNTRQNTPIQLYKPSKLLLSHLGG